MNRIQFRDMHVIARRAYAKGNTFHLWSFVRNTALAYVPGPNQSWLQVMSK